MTARKRSATRRSCSARGSSTRPSRSIVRIIEDQPADWNTANTLGDLYVRAGQVDKAMLLELQADAGEYRDISKCLEQLKVQMGS